MTNYEKAELSGKISLALSRCQEAIARWDTTKFNEQMRILKNLRAKLTA